MISMRPPQRPHSLRSTAELKRWITVTAPVLSAPQIPSRRARRRSHAKTAPMKPVDFDLLQEVADPE